MTDWERDAWEFEQSQAWDNEPLDDVLAYAHLDEPPDLPEMDSNIPF